MLGRQNRDLYEAVCYAIHCETTESRPLLHNDADRWLERDLEHLATAIAGEMGIVGKSGWYVPRYVTTS